MFQITSPLIKREFLNAGLEVAFSNRFRIRVRSFRKKKRFFLSGLTACNHLSARTVLISVSESDIQELLYLLCIVF